MVTTTGLYPAARTMAASITSRGWPVFTVSPGFTDRENPLPAICTVSIPAWTRISVSPQASPTAWPVSLHWVTVPSAGARIRHSPASSGGSIPAHGPKIPSANAGSGSFSIGTICPLRQAAAENIFPVFWVSFTAFRKFWNRPMGYSPLLEIGSQSPSARGTLSL